MSGERSPLLQRLADEARPQPLTDEERAQFQELHPGAVLLDWAPPGALEPETARERQLYRMGYYDGWVARDEVIRPAGPGV